MSLPCFLGRSKIKGVAYRCEAQSDVILNSMRNRADEVHVRRIHDKEGAGGSHHRVLAAITIKGSVDQVWSVLTEYERFNEFIPNCPTFLTVHKDKLEDNLNILSWRALDTQATIEVKELPKEQIIFHMVDGDFDMLHGEWSLQAQGRKHTRLRYKMELKAKPKISLSGIDVEEVLHEDVPSNLCAIRERVESSRDDSEFENGDSTEPENSLPASSSRRESPGGRPPKSTPSHAVPESERQQDIEARLRKFIEEVGTAGTLPTRAELREHRRFDLERFIMRGGGFETVASQLGLKLSYGRKQRHYWDDFDNLKRAVYEVQEKVGCAPSVLPTRSVIIRAGRRDLARAFERWGGMGEVSRLMGIAMMPRKKTTLGEDDGSSSDSGQDSSKKRSRRPKGSMEVKRKAPLKAPLPSGSKWKTLASNDNRA